MFIMFSVWSSTSKFNFMSPCFQVKLRFQKFLKTLFGKLLDEQAGSGQDASSGPPAAGDTPKGMSGATSDAAPVRSADDGLQGVSAHVLVVSHGAYIRVAIKHLIEDLKCSLPPGSKAPSLLSPCPNTGISRFILTLSQSESGPVLSAARCIFTNRKDHLKRLTAAE